MRIIIPSFDRPIQLELLLRSLRENWSIDDLEIKVLYKWSNDDFFDGYIKLIEEIDCTNIEFAPETDDFCEIIKYWVETAGDVIGFLTDDSVMFRRPLVSPQEVESILNYGNIATFSLRLSPSCVVQNYLTGELQPKLQYGNLSTDYPLLNDVIFWKWNKYNQNYNWSYIFSWDGHFYDKYWLWDLVKDTQWENPRALEYRLSQNPALRDSNKPYMASCMTSSIIVNTINCVQPGGPLAGTKYPYSTQMLNDKWLNGERISLESFAGQPIISSHEEFPLTWERSDRE